MRPILIHAILETAEGVKNVEAIAKRVFSPDVAEVKFAFGNPGRRPGSRLSAFAKASAD